MLTYLGGKMSVSFMNFPISQELVTIFCIYSYLENVQCSYIVWNLQLHLPMGISFQYYPIVSIDKLNVIHQGCLRSLLLLSFCFNYK